MKAVFTSLRHRRCDYFGFVLISTLNPPYGKRRLVHSATILREQRTLNHVKQLEDGVLETLKLKGKQVLHTFFLKMWLNVKPPDLFSYRGLKTVPTVKSVFLMVVLRVVSKWYLALCLSCKLFYAFLFWFSSGVS